MKKKNYLWLMILISGLLISGCKPADNKLTEEEISDGWELLFDGKTLDGWRDFKGEPGVVTAPWKVEKGTLTALGTGSDSTGYIVSEKEYGNFILTFDWKIAKGGNSGLLYHVVERPEYKVPYVTGPEYQLIDDIGFPDKLEEWQKAGADYAMYLPDNSKKKSLLKSETGTDQRLFSTMVMLNTGLTIRNFLNLKHGQTTGLPVKKPGNGILLRNTDLPAAVLSHFRITEAEPGSGILR